MNEESYANVINGQMVSPDRRTASQSESDQYSKDETPNSDRDSYMEKNGHTNYDSPVPAISELSPPLQEIIYDTIQTQNGNENVDITAIQDDNQESITMEAQIETLPQKSKMMIPSLDLSPEKEDKSDKKYIVEKVILQKGIGIKRIH